MFVDSAAAFFKIVENTEPMAISKPNKTMPVTTRKLLSVIAHFFQVFNVCAGQHHFSLFTTYSAMRAMHKRILV
jgi:hypothetical protein